MYGMILNCVCWYAALPFLGQEDQEQLQCCHPQEAVHEQNQPPTDLPPPPCQVHGRKGMQLTATREQSDVPKCNVKRACLFLCTCYIFVKLVLCMLIAVDEKLTGCKIVFYLNYGCKIVNLAGL